MPLHGVLTPLAPITVTTTTTTTFPTGHQAQHDTAGTGQETTGVRLNRHVDPKTGFPWARMDNLPGQEMSKSQAVTPICVDRKMKSWDTKNSTHTIVTMDRVLTPQTKKTMPLKMKSIATLTMFFVHLTTRAAMRIVIKMSKLVVQPHSAGDGRSRG